VSTTPTDISCAPTVPTVAIIEEAISELETAQNALKEKNRDKAYNLLSNAKAQIPRAMFQLMTSEPDRELLTDNFLIKAPKDFLRSETGWNVLA